MRAPRLSFDLRPNPLSVLLAEKRTAGADVLDLTESNPTRAGLEYPQREILEALADPAALRYDPAPRGMLPAREAVSKYYRDRGRDVPASRILLTASTSEAYAYLFKLLAGPGDEVAVPRPSYPLFEFLAAMESVTVKQYPLRYDGAWHVDFAALERSISPRTRAIVVVNPNNPTGSFVQSDSAQRLEEIALRHGIAILCDEVFLDYGFAEDPNRASGFPGAAPVFAMSGLSKIAGLPQMKLGWIAASGPGQEESLEKLEWIADTYLSVATPVQLALPKLLDLSGSVRNQIRARTASNLRLLRELVSGAPANVLQVEGGWSAILQAPRTRSEEEWALTLLRDQNVLVQPGFFYDFESEAFLVVSLLTPEAVFTEGARRIRAML